MKYFEITVEVGPIDTLAVERLKTDGWAVFRGSSTWRVQRVIPILADGAVWAQAHVAALEAIGRYRLATVTDPPAIFLSDPDAGLDARPDLLLTDTWRSYDPLPIPRPKRKWYQHAMELGLGERKGD